MNSTKQRHLIKKMFSYFFLNPVEIRMCPFLDDQDCLIYQYRFFGCRSYGLWSKEYYEKLSESSRIAKKHIQKQWEYLGIRLPKEVIEFQVPYCLNVKIIDNTLIDDRQLLNIRKRIEILSQHFTEWHQSFTQQYFSDISFLLTSLVFGVTDSVQLKFLIVRDIVNRGNTERLNKILSELPDLFEEMI